MHTCGSICYPSQVPAHTNTYTGILKCTHPPACALPLEVRLIIFKMRLETMLQLRQHPAASGGTGCGTPQDVAQAMGTTHHQGLTGVRKPWKASWREVQEAVLKQGGEPAGGGTGFPTLLPRPSFQNSTWYFSSSEGMQGGSW